MSFRVETIMPRALSSLRVSQLTTTKCLQLPQVTNTADSHCGLGGIVFQTDSEAVKVRFSSGWQTLANSQQTNIRTIDVTQTENSAEEVMLPPITETLLGTMMTIVRLRPITTTDSNDAGILYSEVPVYILPTSPDLISAPNAIVVKSSGGGPKGIALDPFSILVSVGGYSTPSPYDQIDSATLVAQGTAGNYFWHYI